MTSPLNPLERVPAATVRGTVVVVGGRGESPEVYRRFADRLAFDGYRVVAFGDPTGHERATVDAVRAALDASEAGPRVVVGSDSGNATLWRAVASGALEPDGVVAAGLLTEGGTTTVDGSAEVEQRTACPVHRGRLSTDGVLEAGSLARISEAQAVDADLARSILLPVLAFHGSDDRISDAQAALGLYEKVPSARAFTLDGGLHDVLNDVTHRSVAAEIVQFVERLRTPDQGLRRVDLATRPVAAVA